MRLTKVVSNLWKIENINYPIEPFFIFSIYDSWRLKE